MAPNRKPYRTKDGYIAALIYNDKHWDGFINAVQPAWNNERYATLEGCAPPTSTPSTHWWHETMIERTTEEWLTLVRRARDSGGAAEHPDALFDNEHLNAVGFFETVDTPHGPVRLPGVPTWFSRTPGRVAGPAPLLGADTA